MPAVTVLQSSTNGGDDEEVSEIRMLKRRAHMVGSKHAEKKRNLGQQLRDARYATLDSRAVSDKAKQLVDHLTDKIAKWEIRYGRRQRKRRSGADKLRAAVTGFLGDLLLARKSSDKAKGWVYRSMQAQSFTGKRVSHRTFAALVDALKDLGMVEYRPSVSFWGTGFDSSKQSVHRRFAARFRANAKLVKLCEDTASPILTSQIISLRGCQRTRWFSKRPRVALMVGRSEADRLNLHGHPKREP